MDRQLRNIGLLTLLVAALGSVAVLSAEHHRSTLNTLILCIAAVAAVGSGLALVGGSVWFGVVRKDATKLWNDLPHRRWRTSHHVALDLKEEAKVAGVDLVFTSPNENAARARGVPCMIVGVGPRRMGYARRHPLRGSTVTCEVRRGRESRAVEVPSDQEVYNSAVARWPDEWFRQAEATPLPGRYRVRWTLRLADGSVAHPIERLRINDQGQMKVLQFTRVWRTTRAAFRHLRGK